MPLTETAVLFAREARTVDEVFGCSRRFTVVSHLMRPVPRLKSVVAEPVRNSLLT